MSLENQRLVAALISAHPDQQVVGRTRLQKEVRLLQRLGFPTDYPYTIHFYGPYSETLQADIGLMDVMGLLCETREQNAEGNNYYILRASDSAELPDISKFEPYIKQLLDANPIVLELAATYDAFLEQGGTQEDILARLRQKKGEKCTQENVEAAISLLKSLDLLSC